MSISNELLQRAENKCELCGEEENLTTYTVPPKSGDDIDHTVLICQKCQGQIDHPETMDPHHWRCLNDSMWSPVSAVQVVVYRLLDKLKDHDWALDAQGMMYMDDETLEWANDIEEAIVHKDSNGHVLKAGDTVVLIKDLNVKGANFTAKRGTAVRRIRLVPDNPGQIEGKVEGQQIVILTEFVKKV